MKFNFLFLAGLVLALNSICCGQQPGIAQQQGINVGICLQGGPNCGPTLSSLNISPSNASLVNGLTLQMLAEGVESDGSDGGPYGPQCDGKWSSSNIAVAVISPQGLATGVSAGTTTISCQFTTFVGGSTLLTVVSAPYITSPSCTGTPCLLPGTTNGASYSYTLAAIGGSAPYSWSVTAGSFSGCGVSLSSGGVISGTASTGVCTPTVQVTDHLGSTASLLVSLTVTASSGCTSGPPTYGCSSTSVANYAGYPTALFPIFTSTSAINSTNLDTTLNASYDCYTALATTGVGNVTQSGGANDVDTSVSGTYLYLRLNGHGQIYHTQQVASTANCPNGAIQIINTNSVLQTLYCKTGNSCSETNLASGHPNTILNSGPTAFSRATDNVVYFLVNYTQLWKETITSDTSIASQLLFNFAAVGNCPEITSSTPIAQSASILGVAGGDSAFDAGISFTGGQGTAVQEFVYKPGSGCALLNANTGNWYNYCASSCSTVSPSGTETVCNQANNPSGHGFHDSQMSLDGSWIVITNTLGYPNSTGSSAVCQSPPGGGFYLNWQVATGNIVISSGLNGDVGHAAQGYTHRVNTDFPTPNIRSLAAPNTSTQIYQFPSPMGNEIHGTWTHSAGDDVSGSANVWFLTDSNHPVCCGIVDATPTYLNNEIFGIFPNAAYPPGGTPVRFGHNFKDESSTSFGCQDTISNVSQDGRYLFFGTSMLGQWSGCGAAIILLQ